MSAVEEPQRPTGAQIAALQAHCPSFHGGDAMCCSDRLEPELCDYHRGWIDAWFQAKEAMR